MSMSNNRFVVGLNSVSRYLSFVIVGCLCFHTTSLLSSDKNDSSLAAEAAVNAEYLAVGNVPIDENYILQVSSKPDLQKRKLSQLKVSLVASQKNTDANYQLISFDADMPEHQHGMVVQASKPKKISDGEKAKLTYLVDGVKLHMPGKWVLRFELKKPGVKESIKLSLPIQVKI